MKIDILVQVGTVLVWFITIMLRIKLKRMT